MTKLIFQIKCVTVMQWSRSCLHVQVNWVRLPETLYSVSCIGFFLCLEGTWGVTVLSFFSSGISVILIFMCGIAVSSSPAVYGFSPFWLTVFGKRRSFTVLRYHSFVLSCLIQVNTICSKNHSKLNRLIKVKYFRLNGNDRAFQSL